MWDLREKRELRDMRKARDKREGLDRRDSREWSKNQENQNAAGVGISPLFRCAFRACPARLAEIRCL